MPIEIGNPSIVQNTQSMLRDTPQKSSGATARISRHEMHDVEQVVDDSISHPLSSEGHAGPGGQKGGALDVTA